MEYRKLGRTGEKVSVIGMGTWKVGDGGKAESRDQIAALQRGMELGINLIDTAEIYGDGKSEQLVAEAVKGDRSNVFIASKVWSDHLHHDDVLAACDRSLQRLGVDHIDLYQIHWPNPSVPIKETMSAMEELLGMGKIRYIGVSNFSVEQTKEAQDALAKAELVSDQVEYSLSKPKIEADLLPYCEKEGITVIAYSPLAKGKLPSGRIPAQVLEKYHMTPAQVMLNWVTRKKNVVAIPKSAKASHAEENAVSVSVRFTEAEYDLISNSFG